MNVTDLPIALLFLLPGFLFLHLFFFVSRIRRISAFYATTWSLLLSLFLFAGVYWPYTAVVAPSTPAIEWPTVLVALTTPLDVPTMVWVITYASAVALGVVLGVLERIGVPFRLLLKLGVDLRRHGDLWERLLKDQRLGRVRVYLKDGELLAGWPKYYSDDRTDPGPELYLSPAFVWDIDREEWANLEHVEGVLIHGSEIGRIEFVAIGPEDSTAQNDR